MRARALSRPARVRTVRKRTEVSRQGGAPALTPAGLVFLRGRDADARLRTLGATRVAARPLLGALAGALVARRAHEKLGYRSLGDYARERLGVGARAVREWARVWRALGELPRLRRALLEGEVSWGVLRLVVAHVTPETEEACLASVRGRTLRAVQAIVAAVKEAESELHGPSRAGAPADAPGEVADEPVEERVLVRLACTRGEANLWRAAVELSRRVAGEALPVWACAERIAAEAASAVGGPPEGSPDPIATGPGSPQVAAAHRGSSCRARRTNEPGSCEPGLRAAAFPEVDWTAAVSALPTRVAALAHGLDDAPPREVDRRLRAVIAFLQQVDLETGRILRQMSVRDLFAELGFPSLARYAQERLDVSARTARRLVALARTEHAAPAVAVAFRRGKLHAFQARTLARAANLENARAWVARARQITLRRLEDEVEAITPTRGAIAFRAPPDVAAFFAAMITRAGSLARLLAHAVQTWVAEGARFRDSADFTRDGYRCTAPGCTARRNLQSHHIRFRSAGGADAPWNRTTLCAAHHQRAVHGERTLRIRGRAPDALVFALGPEPAERFRSGDTRLPPLPEESTIASN